MGAGTMNLPDGFVLDPAPVKNTAATLPEGFALDNQDSYWGQVAQNALPSFGRLFTPLLHPIDTAKAIGTLVTKPATDLGKAAYGVVGNKLGLLSADEMPQVDSFNPVVEYGKVLKDRYGSLEKAQETLKTDPAGFLADLSTLVTAGGSAASRIPGLAGAGAAAKTAGIALDPVNLALNTAKAVTSPLIPKGMPAALYESAAKWRPSIDKEQRANMTNTALTEGLMPTEAGVGKAAMLSRNLSNQVEGIIDNISNATTPIPADIVLRNLHQLQNELGGFKFDAPADIARANGLINDFTDYIQATGRSTVTPRDLQEFKKSAWKHTNFDAEQGSASYAQQAVRKNVGNTAKTMLENLDPRIKGLNQRLGNVLELQPELERAAARIANRNLISLDTAAKIGAGAAADASSMLGGNAGTVIGTLSAMLGMPQAKAKIAIYLHGLKNSGVTDKMLDNAAMPAELRQVIYQARNLTSGGQ